MKIAHLSTSDIKGGAAKAAYRLHQGLLKMNVKSQMLVQDKVSDDRTVMGSSSKLEKGWNQLKPMLNSIPLQFYPERDRTFYSPQWFPDSIAAKMRQVQPDIINLHWINKGFLQIETLAKFNKPIVWTLHDMWAFTGGCHYSGECDRYSESCGACPQLHSKQNQDLSRWIWNRKAKAWQDINLTIVTPGNWLAQCAKASSLFHNLPIKVIPNGIDTQIYKPIDRQLARKIIGLSPDKKIILFGAVASTSDRRKGFHLLIPALQKLKHLHHEEQIELLVFGASEPIDPPDFSYRVRYLGRFSDDISLAVLYAAADVFVAPSIQDNLPNTVMEALACGTPCVAFDIGGMPDMIEHQQNGYLAQPSDIEDFTQGISWILENKLRSESLSWKARDKIKQEFTVEEQAKKYFKLFEEISINPECK